MVAAGFDAGVRYDERLEQDMIAVPIGPRVQRFAVAAAPAYLAAHGRPKHPQDLLAHACIRHRFPSGATPPWEFERKGKIVRVTPSGPLIANTLELKLSAAIAGLGIVHSFEEHLAASIARGALESDEEELAGRTSGSIPRLRRSATPACAAARLHRLCESATAALVPEGLRRPTVDIDPFPQ